MNKYFFLSIVSLLGIKGYAQQPIEEDTVYHRLEDVVFSASKFEEKKSDVAPQIMVITKDEIQAQSQQTTADLLQSSGKILVQKSQMGGGSPIIRGFEANKVLMVVDGVRMNNAIYRGGHLQNVISVDQTSLERLEVVYGPGSVIYGSDALGGVVHFYTQKPLLNNGNDKIFVKTKAFARYATANQEKTGHVQLNLGWAKIASLTSFTYSDFGDLLQGRQRSSSIGTLGQRDFYAQVVNGKDSMMRNTKNALQKGTGYNQWDFMQKILIKTSPTWEHILNFQYSSSTDVPRYDRLTEIDSKTGLLKHAQWYYGPQTRNLLSYHLNLSRKTKWFDVAKAVVARQHIIESRHNRSFGKSSLAHRTENVWVYSINLDLAKQLGKNEIRYGAELSHNSVASTAYSENIKTGVQTPLDTRYPGKGSTMTSAALYISNAYEMNPKWIFTQGVRYSRVHLDAAFDNSFFPFPFTKVSQKSGALNGQLGLIFMPEKTWRFAVLGSSGFRAPNVDDLSKVFESTAGKVIVPNPDLKPEYVYNVEATINKTMFKDFAFEVNGFYSWFRDVIVASNAKFNGKDSIQYNGSMSQVITHMNKDKAFVYGGSVAFKGKIGKWIGLNSSVNYTHGRVHVAGQLRPLDHIPPVYGKSGLQINIKRFESEFFVLYNGWKRIKDYSTSGEDNQIYATKDGMPSWYTLNVRTSYKFSKNVQLQIALENILDRNYRVFASGISAAGRNFMVTLRGEF